MTKYFVSITLYTINRVYDEMHTTIIESDKTAKELETEIIEYNNKKKNRVKRVSVVQMGKPLAVGNEDGG